MVDPTARLQPTRKQFSSELVVHRGSEFITSSHEAQFASDDFSVVATTAIVQRSADTEESSGSSFTTDGQNAHVEATAGTHRDVGCVESEAGSPSTLAAPSTGSASHTSPQHSAAHQVSGRPPGMAAWLEPRGSARSTTLDLGIGLTLAGLGCASGYKLCSHLRARPVLRCAQTKIAARARGRSARARVRREWQAALVLQTRTRGYIGLRHASGLRAATPHLLALRRALRTATAMSAKAVALAEEFDFSDGRHPLCHAEILHLHCPRPGYSDQRRNLYTERVFRRFDNVEREGHAARTALRLALDALQAAARPAWSSRPGTIDFKVHGAVQLAVEAGEGVVRRLVWALDDVGIARCYLDDVRDDWTDAILPLQALTRGWYTRRRLSALHSLHAFGTHYKRPSGIYLHRVIGGRLGVFDGGSSFDFIYCTCKTIHPSDIQAISVYINTPPAAGEVLPGGNTGDGLQTTCLPHATATSLPTAAHQDHGTLGATLDVTARTPPKAAANRRNHKARLKAAAARADELTKRGQVTVIGDMIYQTGSMACDCAAERFEMQDGIEPHDMLDDDDYVTFDDDIGERLGSDASDASDASY